MAVTYPTIIAERLKQIMHERGMTQRAVAGEIGTTESAVSCWKHGKRTPRAEYIVAMCVLFGVSADWLLGMDRVI